MNFQALEQFKIINYQISVFQVPNYIFVIFVILIFALLINNILNLKNALFATGSFLQTILNESKLSNEFFEQYRVLAFPIINPDGVDLGHWRHNAGGIDLNRDWSFYRQPEVRNVVSFINKTSKKDSGKIILGIDFHSTWKDVFYTNKKREGTTLPNFVDVWFRSLEKNIPNYKVNEESQN
ncbi:MAG: M14 family zinc carboxypeptidase, partial [Candidatus Nanopelagicaceae bacterium]